MAALEHRRITGEGQMVDLSQVESTASFLGPALLDFTVNGRDSEQGRNRSPEMSPHGVFPCRGDDRWCAIAVEDEDSWRALCEVAGKLEWLADDRFTNYDARKQNEDALEAVIASWTGNFDHFELAETLQRAGVAAAPVASTYDLLFGDKHLAERDYYHRVEHPEAGMRATDGPPFSIDGLRTGPFRPAPLLGEHTDLVLREILGYDEEKIAGLYVEGAVG
jgi:benzylsuccinate CoA-transferase BbsF subunit